MLQTKEARDDFVVEVSHLRDTSATGSYAGWGLADQEVLRNAYYDFSLARATHFFVNLESAYLLFDALDQLSQLDLLRLTNQLVTTESLLSTSLTKAPDTAYDDFLIDEPLEPVPVKEGTMRVLLRYAGKGEPALQSDTELQLLDDAL